MDTISLQKKVSLEYNLIKTSETIGGALTHFASLFSKIRTFPTVNYIIALVEDELAEELAELIKKHLGA